MSPALYVLQQSICLLHHFGRILGHFHANSLAFETSLWECQSASIKLVVQVNKGPSGYPGLGHRAPDEKCLLRSSDLEQTKFSAELLSPNGRGQSASLKLL